MTTQQAKDEGTAIEGIDIIVNGGTPEFEICKLYDSVDKSVHGALGLSLEKLLSPSSSITVTINPSIARKVIWTLEDPETGGKVVATVVTVTVQGHGSGEKELINEPKLGRSIAEGVTEYIKSIKDNILEHETCITEIKVMTNIKKAEYEPQYLTFKIPISGTPEQLHVAVPWQEAAMLAGWTKDIIPVCGTCHSNIIGQTKIVCGSCSSEYHWACAEITAVREGRSKAKAIRHMYQWLCSSCSGSAENGNRTLDPGCQRRRKRRKVN